MRVSVHGSANLIIDPKDFAKLSPIAKKNQNYTESKCDQSGRRDSLMSQKELLSGEENVQRML